MMAGDSREQWQDAGQGQAGAQQPTGGQQPQAGQQGRRPLWGPSLEFKPRPRQEPGTEPGYRPPRESDGWQILSYMLAGMIFYGGLGWLVSRWTGITLLFPLGMILGVVLSVLLIIFRFTRS